MAYNQKYMRMIDSTLDGVCQTWSYRSTDAMVSVTAAAYFAGADDIGIKLGDVVFIQEVDNAIKPTAIAASGWRVFRVIDPTTGNGTADQVLS